LDPDPAKDAAPPPPAAITSANATVTKYLKVASLEKQLLSFRRESFMHSLMAIPKRSRVPACPPFIWARFYFTYILVDATADFKLFSE
jgi:hypothetical protein